MTALTMPARPEGRRKPAAGAVAADGRGHLAAAPHRAGRRGRAARRAGGVPVDRRHIAAPRLRRRDRLPPGKLSRLPRPGHQLQWHRRTLSSNGVLLQAVPALIGAFAGAPVLARELETGTFRYAWTQGFGRWRWALAKLVPLAVVLAAATGAFGVLVSWYYQPYFATGNQALGLTEILPVLYRPVQPARGRVPRLDAGRLRDRRPGRHAHPPGRPRDRRHPGRLRRARLRDRGVPAPALPDAAGHQQPERARHRVDHQPVVDQGRQVRLRRIPPDNLLNQFCSSVPAIGEGRRASQETFAQCLAQHGYTQWTSYQPASRFWPFQWIEGGWLLALSALLIAATTMPCS